VFVSGVTVPASDSPAPGATRPGPGRGIPDRRATRRQTAGRRARWLAARTRNASRHGLLIAFVGALVMVGTLLAFVLVPRQVDRALGAALGALPTSRDTVALLSARDRADSLRVVVEGRRAAARAAALAALDAAAGMDPATGLPMLASGASAAVAPRAPSPAVAELEQRLARVRQAPLVESYRALAESRALREDPRVRARVALILDSLELVHREREAYAALTGPDARYAALTSRLTALGQQLARLAEDRVAREVRAQLLAARPVREAPAMPVSDRDPALPDSAAVPLIGGTVLSDTLLEVAVREAQLALAAADSAVTAARRHNEAVQGQRIALRERMQVSIPPVAMLFASLVLGLCAGFVLALWREVRRPTVGDAEELESIAKTRVIEYRPDAAVLMTRRRRRDDVHIPVLTSGEEAWPLLHLTLTNIGEVAPAVQVLAHQPVLAGAVALNLAAVAARESRATVVVDAAIEAGAVVPLLPPAALQRTAPPRGGEDVWWDGTRALALGRDVSVDVVLPRRARHGRQRGSGPAGRRVEEAPEERTALAERVRGYDLTVYVTDHAAAPVLPPMVDVVLCARLGVTPLGWLARAARTAEERGHRVRAVLLWATNVPLAG
jgi:hypothetical protein